MAEDRTGMKFGKLTVIRDSGQKAKYGGTLWECLCECGNTKLTQYSHLNNGTVSSCGCAKKRGKDEFVALAKKIHGDTYDYSMVNFVKSKQKVDIICKDHGVFSQTPHNHIAGKHGCPTCGRCGFDQALPSSVYVMEVGDITKVGITNRTAKQRATSIRCNTKIPFKVLKEYPKLDGKLCWDVETILLKELAVRYKRVEDKFDGSTECFYDVDKAWLLNTIEENIERYKNG